MHYTLDLCNLGHKWIINWIRGEDMQLAPSANWNLMQHCELQESGCVCSVGAREETLSS